MTSSPSLGAGAIVCLGWLLTLVVLWANRRRSPFIPPLAALCLLGLAATPAYLLWLQFGRSRPLAAGDVLPAARDQGFVGSDSCRDCHRDQHASWHATYHRTMTQVATPQAVVAPFDQVRLTTGRTHAELYRRGDEFWADIVDPEWELEMLAQGQDASRVPDPPRRRVRIVMTTGSHHFQAYWYQSEQGRELWQFPWRYHIGRGQWLHRRDVFFNGTPWRPGMQFQVWNRNCILCHSTGGQPGQNVEHNVMDKTRVAELGIACEACHGPGAEHVARMRSAQPPAHFEQWAIVNPARLSPERSSQVCGRCHSHFQHTDGEVFTTGTNYRPGDRLTNYGRLLTADDEEAGLRRYWADGTNCSGGREYSGMSDSACFQQGSLSCLSCHSMHSSDPNGQVTPSMRGNEGCYQCHDEYRERLVQHTHHAADSEGSRCYNCHMPHTSLALLKAIRNHRIDSPQVQGLAGNGRPNACNLCHLDQTLDWTASHLRQWYGQASPELTDEERQVAASLLWLLRGDAMQRAVAAWHFGWQPAQEVSGTDWMPPHLAQGLEDRFSGIAWLAADSLRKLPDYAREPLPNDARREDNPRQAREILEAWLQQPQDADTQDPNRLRRLLLAAPREIDTPRVNALRDQRPEETFMVVE